MGLFDQLNSGINNLSELAKTAGGAQSNLAALKAKPEASVPGGAASVTADSGGTAMLIGVGLAVLLGGVLLMRRGS